MKAKQTHRIQWLARALTGTGMLMLATTIGMVGLTLHHIRNERALATSQQNELNTASEDLARLTADAHSQIQIVLDEIEPKATEERAVGEFADRVHSELAANPDPSLLGPLNDLNQEATTLKNLAKQCDAWRASFGVLATDMMQETTIGKVRGQIAAMQDALEDIRNQNRLDEGNLNRQWSHASGEQADALAEQMLLAEGRQKNENASEFESQLATVARLVEVIRGEEKYDSMNDLKDKQLKPALDGMARSVAAFAADPANNGALTPEAVQSLYKSIFGAGYRVDEVHQTILAGPGGLFTVRWRSLELRQQRDAVRREVGAVFENIDKTKSQFDQLANVRADALAREMQLTVADAWRRMLLIGGACLAIFVWLAILISRGIYAQLTAIEEARAEAEAERQTTDRLMLEQRAAHAELDRAATHDRLTGLPNRVMFHNRLSNALELAKRNEDFRIAVLFLDFDRFKIVNDSLGHEAGDLLLIGIAERLTKTLRNSDIVSFDETGSTTARLGGDEFCILLAGLTHERDAAATAARLLKELDRPYTIAGREVHSTASIGIATSASGYDRAEEMIRDADTAMYRAKAEGKNRFVIFDRAMHEQAMRKLTVESELRRAVEQNLLVVHYQPLVSLETSLMTGAEALVRWQHPQRGLIEPSDFIPIAEESGLINLVGAWVLQNCARQIKDWQCRYPAIDLAINVNVSNRQLCCQDFVAQVESIVRETGIAPRNLIFEVTETGLVSNSGPGALVLHELRAKGYRFFLDDFGTGYSSLSMLHTIQMDGLKIDRSFIRDATGRRQYAAIIQAITDLAHNLGMEVVAEGIEQEDQVVLLQSLNCEKAQGYLFSHPLPAAEFEKLLGDAENTNLWPKRSAVA